MTNQNSFFYKNLLRGTKDFIGFTYTAVREPFQEESRWPLSSSTKWSSSNRDIGFQMASPSLFPYIYIWLCMYVFHPNFWDPMHNSGRIAYDWLSIMVGYPGEGTTILPPHLSKTEHQQSTSPSMNTGDVFSLQDRVIEDW